MAFVRTLAEAERQGLRRLARREVGRVVTLDGHEGMTAATLHITDAGTGVSSFRVFLTGPTGNLVYCQGQRLVRGTANDGIWACDVTIPPGSAPGTWRFTQWDAFDRASNSRLVDGTAAAVLAQGVTVVNPQPDVDAPRLVSINFAPATVALGGGSGTATASVHMTDVGTGVSGFRVFLTGPTGNLASCSSPRMTSGTVNDGYWTCDVTLPAGSAPGSWAFTQWDAFDATSNWRYVDGSTAAELSPGIIVQP